jgi:hypothetical protein
MLPISVHHDDDVARGLRQPRAQCGLVAEVPAEFDGKHIRIADDKVVENP